MPSIAASPTTAPSEHEHRVLAPSGTVTGWQAGIYERLGDSGQQHLTFTKAVASLTSIPWSSH
jgi:hypothetical protein